MSTYTIEVVQAEDLAVGDRIMLGDSPQQITLLSIQTEGETWIKTDQTEIRYQGRGGSFLKVLDEDVDLAEVEAISEPPAPAWPDAPMILITEGYDNDDRLDSTTIGIRRADATYSCLQSNGAFGFLYEDYENDRIVKYEPATVVTRTDLRRLYDALMCGDNTAAIRIFSRMADGSQVKEADA